MDGLLSLPPELLAMIGRKLIGSVLGPTCGSHMYVFNFALTCKGMYSVLEHILFGDIRIYHTREATELRYQRLLPLIRAIEREPTLGTHLKKFKLCLSRRRAIRDVDGRKPYLAEVTRQCESFGSFLHACAPNMEALKMPYPLGCDFLGRTWAKLVTLTVSSMDGALRTCSEGLENVDWLQDLRFSQGLDVAFLATVLHSPQLRGLSLEATRFSGEEAVSNLQPRSISLQRLIISTHGKQDPTVSALLQAPKALAEFRLPCCLQRHKFESCFDVWDEDLMPESLRLPRLTTIHEGLRHHSTTPKHLYIHGASFSINRSLNTGHHSFRGFSCLRIMEVDINMLLGWENCWFSRKPLNKNRSLPPRALDRFLPDSLQDLVLYIDNDYRRQKGHGYMHQIMLGIIDEADRLNCLKTIRLAPDYVHCWDCSEADRRIFDDEDDEGDGDDYTKAQTIAECDEMKRLADSMKINFKVSDNGQKQGLPYW